MADPKVTQAFAVTFVDQLARAGLRHVCLAPGSRSAAFFGLGIAKATERAVALLCTSGTAAAELHPAVIESHHSRTPLLVLTADRPPELREVGANQAIDQARLYGSAVRWFFDPGPPDDAAGPRAWRRLARRAVAEALGPPAGPVHLNLPFREPLTPPVGEPVELEPGDAAGSVVTPVPEPGDQEVEVFASALERSSRPVLVAGGMTGGARLADAVAALAEA